MKLHGLKFLLAACIVCFICATSAEAARCEPDAAKFAANTGWLNNPAHPVIGYGLRYATVNYAAGANAPTQGIQNVLEDAVLQWNVLACVTGIVFIPSTGGLADLDFFRTTLDSNAGGCAVYEAPGYDITYGPSWESRLANLGATEARAVIMHEIGHFLGLGHTNFPLASTIMTQGSCSLPAAVTSLTLQDAQQVGECLNSGAVCEFWPFFPPLTFIECEEHGGYWNFSIGGCFEAPQPEPCVDCWDNDDCCYGDVCHNGVCGPPEIACPPCPPDTVCYDGLCSYATPVLIDVDGDGFKLTNVAGGVDFDFTGDGQRRRLPWTAAGSDDAWLVLDRNHNGQIDSGREMFGNVSPQPKGGDRNGFVSLAEFDRIKFGGNGDGVIDNRDYIFRQLRLWNDVNHNGTSEATELSSLDQHGVAVVELAYKLSSRTDRYGNEFRYRAKVKDANGAQLGRWAWDVIFKGRGK